MNDKHPFQLSNEQTEAVSGGFNSPYLPTLPVVTLAYNEDGYPFPPDITLAVGEDGSLPPDWWT